ncbi:MAG TPA: coproporphyrinogen-III oxidase family protein [Elusimicrobiales bacterium]|nr:coproporphyrinogen-III oxidase family protein [Elusimicrobiales bacterium]
MDDSKLKAIFGLMDAENPPEYPPHYPPPALWRKAFSGADAADAWRRALARRGDLVLYVHLPFCREVCSFCGFYARPCSGPAAIDDYLSALEREARLLAPLFKGRRFKWLCFGGGTPSLLSGEQLERLFAAVKGAFRPAAGARIAFESHPDSLDPAKLRLLKKLGVDWLSIGVQTFDDAVLRRNGRRQDNSRVPGLVRAARAAGIKNVQLDLIAGLPFQSEAVFMSDVEKAARLDPERIYLFPFQSKSRVRLKAPQASWLWDAYRRAVESLAGRGYELSCGRWLYRKGGGDWPYSYDQGERMSRDFYSVLGLGAGAISYARHGARYQNETEPAAYARALRAGRLPVARGRVLGETEEMINFVLLNLLQRGTLEEKEFRSVFGRYARRVFGAELAALSAEGALTPTAEGWLLGDRERGLFSLRKTFFSARDLAAAARACGPRLGPAARDEERSSQPAAALPLRPGTLVFEAGAEPAAVQGARLLRAVKERRPREVFFSCAGPAPVPALPRLVDLARRAGCAVSVSLPPCLQRDIPGPFPYAPGGGAEPGVLRPGGWVKPARCADCSLQLRCPGLEAAWAARHGTRAVKPFRSRT